MQRAKRIALDWFLAWRYSVSVNAWRSYPWLTSWVAAALAGSAAGCGCGIAQQTDAGSDAPVLCDNGANPLTDPSNCGRCGNVCNLPNAIEGCTNGNCVVVACSQGFWNNNNMAPDGCEYACTPDPVGASTEVGTQCTDGIDNDCDGFEDLLDPTNCDGCHPETVCDGVDDDCDGLIDAADPDYMAPPCGLGVCQAPGACLALPDLYQCTPSAPVSPTDTECNNLDDDCDGTVDEDYVPYTCGMGVCLRMSTCVSGLISCTEGPPTAATDSVCDGLDEDCDGPIDEEWISVSECGDGACTRASYCDPATGSEACVAGMPVPETCNGLDDDCNLATDEAPLADMCGTPPNGTVACAGACVMTSCTSGWYDYNATASDGCECTSQDARPDLCGGADNLGDLPDSGSTLTVTANLVPTGDEDWVTFTATDAPDSFSCDTFDVKVQFTSNPFNQYGFDLYRGGCGAPATCSGVSGTDLAQWTTRFYTACLPAGCLGGECNCNNNLEGNVGVGYHICSDNTAVFAVRIYRVSGVPSCDPYTLTISNGL